MFSAYDRWKLQTPEEAAGVPWCRHCETHHDPDDGCEDPDADDIRQTGLDDTCEEVGCANDGSGECPRCGDATTIPDDRTDDSQY